MIFALKYYIKKIFWSDQRNIDTFLRLCIFSDITTDRYVDWPDPSVNILTIQSRFFPRQVLNHHLQFLKTSIFHFLCDYIWKSTKTCSQVRHQLCYHVQTWSLVTCRLLSPRHGREQLTCRLVLIARPVLGLPACTLHSRPWASEDKSAVLCRMTLGPQMLPLNDNSILRKLYWVVDKAPENVPSRVCRCGLTYHSHNSLRHLDPRRSCASHQDPPCCTPSAAPSVLTALQPLHLHVNNIKGHRRFSGLLITQQVEEPQNLSPICLTFAETLT